MDIYLFVFFIMFFFITFVLPTWLLYRKTGINPFVVPSDDSVQGFIGIIFRLLILLVLVAVGVQAFFSTSYPYLVLIEYLDLPIINWAGWILIHLSLLLILIAQRQMKLSWRIGIDEKNETEMVTKGIFRFSRNPIFLGILMCLAGLFLIIPNAVTLVIVVLSWAVLQVQVRLEEEFLLKKHGVNYESYKKRTRRWI